MKVIRSCLQNGQPRILEDTGVYYEFCCDCDLTHIYTVDIDPKKKTATLKFYRDNYSTKKYRKKNKIIVYRKK